MPTATASPKTARCLHLPCPRCGEPQANIALHLYALDSNEALHCHECDNDFSLVDVRTFLERWGKVLAWIDQAPAGA